jgi:tetratricopeptide (TPR) repeat protein
MKTINKYKNLAIANESFSKADYETALRHYALVLKDYPNTKEAYNGAILSEMAMSGEEGAEALFDYYVVLREENKEEADTIISEILQSLDGTLEHLGQLFSEPMKEKLEFEDGIMYHEFKELVENEGDFKRIFENIMFSTRVIITEKKDFIDFLQNLVVYGFSEMALSYLESALVIYPNNEELRDLVKKLAQGSTIEN